MGSSPRVRGKRHGADPAPPVLGLIPACAGKTIDPHVLIADSRAHPRVCGENPSWVALSRLTAGSSPRVRGKLRRVASSIAASGLIPACAGKTSWSRSRQAHRPAHPRVCGENKLLIPIVTGWPAHPRVCGENACLSRGFIASAGSSPRVRGKHFRTLSMTKSVGLIPACAGKTRP